MQIALLIFILSQNYRTATFHQLVVHTFEFTFNSEEVADILFQLKSEGKGGVKWLLLKVNNLTHGCIFLAKCHETLIPAVSHISKFEFCGQAL